jgi:uncharacterized membrane protein YraQ (UPF0718 family)
LKKENKMNILPLLQSTLDKVLLTFSHNWYLLLISIIISVALKLYVDQDAVARFMRRNTKNSVLISTGVAVTTPFCSCGTTAVVLGMMASTIPWAPIVAFMVASPLTSPQELFYSAGLFGWPFASAFFAASIILGLVGGGLAAFAESRGWLQGQARLGTRSTSASLPASTPKSAPATMAFSQSQVSYQGQGQFAAAQSLSLPILVASAPTCSCDVNANNENIREENPVTAKKKVTNAQIAREFFDTTWKLFALFFGFTFLGYFINGLIPNEWIQTLFGSGNIYSVPLAATLGLPFYLNTEASMPLLLGLIDSGMSQGAALAFLITGAGTSLGALAGALTIARWRVIGIVIATLWVGAIVLGFGYDIMLIVI